KRYFRLGQGTGRRKWKRWLHRERAQSQQLRRLALWQPFFERPYWQRLWIVQEILLAREIWIFCGDSCRHLETGLIGHSIGTDDLYGLESHRSEIAMMVRWDGIYFDGLAREAGLQPIEAGRIQKTLERCRELVELIQIRKARQMLPGNQRQYCPGLMRSRTTSRTWVMLLMRPNNTSTS
ncbi:hypothetical protein CLAIMM_14896, partial [Cladophialophora immunda]